MFDTPQSAWGRIQTGVTTDTGLNARFLIRAQQAIAGTPRLTLPQASIQVHNDSSLLGALRVTGKDPIFVPPWFEGSGVEDAPNRVTAYRFPQRITGLGGEIRQRQATQGQLLTVHRLAGDRLDHRFVPRGKKGACAPAQHGLPR
jgi:hypothetical protein